MACQRTDGDRAGGEELADMRREFERLERLLAVVREVDRVAVRADSREELEAAVCECLTGEDGYAFAWIAETDPATREVCARAQCGDGGGYLEEIRLGMDDAETNDGPICRALATGEVQVAQRIADDPTFAWQEAAADRGYESMAAIPLRYDGTDFGAVGVYATVPDAFAERELAVLGELGETVGMGLSALLRRRALIAGSVLEVEFEFESDVHTLVAATEELGGRSELSGIVSRSADEYVFYHHVSGVDPAPFVERVAEHERVLEGTVVDEDAGLVYWVVSGPSTATTLGEFGGRMIAYEAEGGSARVVGILPHGTDLRAVIDAIGRRASEAELIAQRTRDRPDHSERRFRTEATDRLTDRQLATLRAAYFSGYHDRPRTSSGEEVAATLGISPSTFHQHHRVGVRKLLGAAFEPHDPDAGGA